MMKSFGFALCLLFATGAQTDVWQPSAGHTQMPLWPGKAPDAVALPGPETMAMTENEKLIGGRNYMYLRNIFQPTLMVYTPKTKNTGAAVMMIP